MTSIEKCQFAKLNDKRYYFSDSTVSFPFGHPSFSDYKRKVEEKIQKIILEKSLTC